ncbi:hypothetical protein [Robertmurraya siralis]|uniref:hypothetical protein n=1 Tax=Robertmurraya siralis TaxID=77777 RepID=UPI0010F8A988|nr:hypothetical protein [Robertmurraya siralis]
MEIIQSLKAVRDVYINYPKRLELNQEELKKIDSEIQDILHVIELTSFNASDGYKWAKELQRLRKSRRMLKDELEQLEKIKDFLNFPKPTEKVINKTIGELRTIESRKENRTYHMRMRKDLQELIK